MCTLTAEIQLSPPHKTTESQSKLWQGIHLGDNMGVKGQSFNCHQNEF